MNKVNGLTRTRINVTTVQFEVPLSWVDKEGCVPRRSVSEAIRVHSWLKTPVLLRSKFLPLYIPVNRA